MIITVTTYVVIVTVIILAAVQCVYCSPYSYYKGRLAVLCTTAMRIFSRNVSTCFIMYVHFFLYTDYLAFSYIDDGVVDISVSGRLKVWPVKLVQSCFPVLSLEAAHGLYGFVLSVMYDSSTILLLYSCLYMCQLFSI